MYEVCSLGILCLEVGACGELRKIAMDFTKEYPSSGAEGLSQIVPEIGARTRERYQGWLHSVLTWRLIILLRYKRYWLL